MAADCHLGFSNFQILLTGVFAMANLHYHSKFYPNWSNVYRDIAFTVFQNVSHPPAYI